MLSELRRSRRPPGWHLEAGVTGVTVSISAPEPEEGMEAGVAEYSCVVPVAKQQEMDPRPDGYQPAQLGAGM